MTLSTTIKIGQDLVDINKPCDVVTALKKMQLKMVTGGLRETVRIDGEEVTFQRANDKRLNDLIKHYETQCARSSGGGRRRFAKTIRYTR